MNVALSPIRTIELFAGVGMLGEGLRAGFDYLGIKARACSCLFDAPESERKAA